MTNLRTPDETKSQLKGDHRYISYAWRVPSLDSDKGEGWAKLAVVDNPGRKRYSASLTATHRGDRGTGFTVESFMLYESIPVAALARARYSAKTFAAFAEAALDVLDKAHPHYENVRAILPTADVASSEEVSA